jgi:hypothetical protein
MRFGRSRAVPRHAEKALTASVASGIATGHMTSSFAGTATARPSIATRNAIGTMSSVLTGQANANYLVSIKRTGGTEIDFNWWVPNG